jgi:hypothetical protein
MMQAGMYRFFYAVVTRRILLDDPTQSTDIWSIYMDHTAKECKYGTRVVIFGRRSTDDVKFE